MDSQKTLDRVFKYDAGSIYDLYVQKVTRKDRTTDELDEVLGWLTGYSPEQLHALGGTTLQAMIDDAPAWNLARSEIRGVICGVRVEEIADPTMQAIRYMDKVVDELARGRALDKIKRSLPVDEVD